MAVVYYTSNDLLVRRVWMADWICDQMDKIAKQICYGELVPQAFNMNFQYVSASLQAVECYSPITTEAQDGVDNCLTEALLDKFFNNITDITGLCFLPKGSTYRAAPLPTPVVIGPVGLGGGEWEVGSDGDTLDIPAPLVPDNTETDEPVPDEG